MSIHKAETGSDKANAALNRVGVVAFTAAIDSTRAFVSSHLYRIQRLEDRDIVMAQIAETTWSNLDAYDPDRGPLGAFVQGIAQKMILRVASTTRRGLPIERNLDELAKPITAAGQAADPLAVLVARFERDRWVRHVTDEVGERDWSIVAAMAIDGSHTNAATVATHLGITVRTLRGIRERVTVTAQTVIAAIAAAEAGRELVPATIDACIPTTRGLAEVTRLMAAGLSASMIAEAVGVSEDSVRHRVAEAEQLRHVALRVIIAEATSWPRQ